MSEEIKFEKAMEKLEKIVEDLETGNIDLEDALKKYEEGVKLSRICQQRLAQAEKKIEILTRSLDGELQKTPFDPEAAEEKEAKAPRAKKGTPKVSADMDAERDENGDLLF